MLIIFDTCTKPDYYKDVHIVLAAPTGSIIRYEYERRLWTEDAQIEAKKVVADGKPISALLMYGQVKSFKKGDDDPTFMLRQDNAIFIPTRFAKVVNFAVDRKPETERDNLYLHLQLEGFISPKNSEIEKLVSSLEERRELPFGRENGHKWISSCPDNVDKVALSANDELHWSGVVDAFASPPSQFQGDVFWRFSQFSTASSSGEDNALSLRDRSTNKLGDIHQFHRDYDLDDSDEYEFSISNHIPLAEERELPPGVSVSIREDASNLLSLPDDSVQLKRNAAKSLKVGVAHINFLKSRYAKIVLETEVPDHQGPYPAGSLVDNVTVSLSKNKTRVVMTLLSVAAAAPAALIAANLIRNSNTGAGIVMVILALVLTWTAAWLWTGEVNPLRKS